MPLTLHHGNLNYSSWSIRAYLVAKTSGLDIETKLWPLGYDQTRTAIRALSGQTAVPILAHDNIIITDSLAITEYLAEMPSASAIWPEATEKRALARVTCAEMHSGFFGLRGQCPVDMRATHPTPHLTAETHGNIERVKHIWRDYRQKFQNDGPYLCGEWSAADAFWAPVATRFKTYGIHLDGLEADYQNALLTHPEMQAIHALAKDEIWQITPTLTGPIVVSPKTLD